MFAVLTERWLKFVRQWAFNCGAGRRPKNMNFGLRAHHSAKEIRDEKQSGWLV